jgi:hypothetical protein
MNQSDSTGKPMKSELSLAALAAAIEESHAEFNQVLGRSPLVEGLVTHRPSPPSPLSQKLGEGVHGKLTGYRSPLPGVRGNRSGS